MRPRQPAGLPVKLTPKAIDDLKLLNRIGQRVALGALRWLGRQPEVGEVIERRGEWAIRMAVLDDARRYRAVYLTDSFSAVEVQVISDGDAVDLLRTAVDYLVTLLEKGERPEARDLLEYLLDTDDEVVRHLIRIRFEQGPS